MSAISESIIEETAIAQFGTASVPTFCGAVMDDGGERAGASAIVFSTRAKSALRKLNPHLRDYLLPRLLSGRVRVGSREAIEERLY